MVVVRGELGAEPGGLPVGFLVGVERRQGPRAAGLILARSFDDNLRAVGHVCVFSLPSESFTILSGPMVQRRLQAAAVAAGVEHRLTGHSGRVGLASELTARGASTADVMLAGGWKTSRMVAHYAAGATAERGAVARYL